MRLLRFTRNDIFMIGVVSNRTEHGPFGEWALHSHSRSKQEFQYAKDEGQILLYSQ